MRNLKLLILTSRSNFNLHLPENSSESIFIYLIKTAENINFPFFFLLLFRYPYQRSDMNKHFLQPFKCSKNTIFPFPKFVIFRYISTSLKQTDKKINK